MADYSNPKASNAILGDLQEIVALIQAGAKMDPSGNTNIPNGAKRVVSVSGGYQIQSYNGSTWVSIGKLIHDCDTLDGKNSNTGTTANTIPVRDKNGALPGNVTGNAATATKLQAARTIDLGGILSATEQSFDGSKPIVIPVNSINVNNEQDNALMGTVSKAHGGTGRTDGAAADVVVSSAQGTVKASAYGQIGDARNVTGQDLDTLTVTGDYIATSATVENHFPYATSNTVISIKVSRSTTNIFQTVRLVGEVWQRRSTSTGSSWYAWEPIGGTKTSTVLIYVSKSGTDANTGLSNSYPVQTISRALSVAKGIAPHGYNNVVVRLCLGEGDWGTATFRSLPYMLQLYPFDNTVPTEYSASLPSFENLEVYNSYVQVAGIVATNRIRANSGTIEVLGGYTRFAEISSQNNSHVIIVGSSNPIEIISKENHTSVFTVGVDSSMYIANERVCNIVENLNLSEGFLFANMNSFVTRFYVMTFTLADGISVTGQKYSLWNRSHCVYGKAELDALPGSEEGVLSNGTLLTNGLWGGGDAHTFMAADATWKKDSSSIYARDVAVNGDTADMASDRGQIGEAHRPGACDFNTLLKSGHYWFTNAEIGGSSNIPVANKTGSLVVYNGDTTGNYVHQLFFQYNSSQTWHRYKITSTWSNWAKFYDELTAPVFTGATSSAAGAKGLVPAPARGQTGAYFLNGAGNFSTVPYLRNGVSAGGYVDALECNTPDGSNRIACIRVGNEMSSEEGFYTLLLGVNTPQNGAPGGIIIRRNLETNEITIEGSGSLDITGDLSVTGTISGQNAFSTGDFVWSYASSKTGFLLCNGAAISRTTYADLYAIIGTKFGTGDGSTTFNLPDMRGRTAQGANGNLGTVLAAGLPNITGAVGTHADLMSASGAFALGGGGSRADGSYNSDHIRFDFNASRSNSIYGKASTVQPPAIALNCFIKY